MSIQTQPILKGQKVYLCAIREDDDEEMKSWNEDPEVCRFQTSDPIKPIHHDGGFSEWLSDLNGDNSCIRFNIRKIDDDSLVGYLGIDEIEWTNQCGEIFVTIGDRTQWGQGLGRDAVETGLGYAFNELNLHRISITVLAYNERAIKLYESLGFVKEGTFREFGQRDGKRYDMYLYGLLRPEWIRNQ